MLNLYFLISIVGICLVAGLGVVGELLLRRWMQRRTYRDRRA